MVAMKSVICSFSKDYLFKRRQYFNKEKLIEDSLVIIPTYNEKENIEDIIKVVFDLEVDFSILVIDDGSPDGTGDIVAGLQSEYKDRLHLLRRKGKLGLGTAYIAGFKYALERDYQYIFEMDADFSHNPHDLVRLREACLDGAADMAVGSRYVSGVNVINWPMSRVLISYFASKYVQFVTGLPINDSTAGFKCYTRQVLEKLVPKGVKFVGYAFQIEMKFNAWKHGFMITEVPIVFTDRTKGHSKMSTGIIKEAILGVIQLKLRSLFIKYY